MDDDQNGAVLTKTPTHPELVYQLKEKEKVKGIEREIADRIKNPLEEGTPLFQRVFERCLSS